MFRDRTLFRSAIVLAFALTLAQIGALAHGYTHLQNAPGGPDRPALHSALCGECATFGAVLVTGASTAAGIALPVGPPCDSTDEPSSSRIGKTARHFFQAQGPPALR